MKHGDQSLMESLLKWSHLPFLAAWTSTFHWRATIGQVNITSAVVYLMNVRNIGNISYVRNFVKKLQKHKFS
jgi:hypothetical protein